MLAFQALLMTTLAAAVGLRSAEPVAVVSTNQPVVVRVEAPPGTTVSVTVTVPVATNGVARAAVAATNTLRSLPMPPMPPMVARRGRPLLADTNQPASYPQHHLKWMAERAAKGLRRSQ